MFQEKVKIINVVPEKTEDQENINRSRLFEILLSPRSLQFSIFHTGAYAFCYPVSIVAFRAATHVCYSRMERLNFHLWNEIILIQFLTPII